jgi:hypothetical protein
MILFKPTLLVIIGLRFYEKLSRNTMKHHVVKNSQKEYFADGKTVRQTSMVDRQRGHDDPVAQSEVNQLCRGVKFQFNPYLRLVVVDGFF